MIERVFSVTALLEQEKQRIEQLTVGWDDPTTVNWDNEEKDEPTEVHETTYAPPPQPIYKCTAVYSYVVCSMLKIISMFSSPEILV